jgi:hypothetical protein
MEILHFSCLNNKGASCFMLYCLLRVVVFSCYSLLLVSLVLTVQFFVHYLILMSTVLSCMHLSYLRTCIPLLYCIFVLQAKAKHIGLSCNVVKTECASWIVFYLSLTAVCCKFCRTCASLYCWLMHNFSANREGLVSPGSSVFCHSLSVSVKDMY